MKNLLFVSLFAIALVFSSCGADQATVDAMADEMCTAMEKYNPEDPLTMVDAASAMLDISTKEEAYGSVSEAQLKSAMEAKCPEGWKKLEDMQKMGE